MYIDDWFFKIRLHIAKLLKSSDKYKTILMATTLSLDIKILNFKF